MDPVIILIVLIIGVLVIAALDSVSAGMRRPDAHTAVPSPADATIKAIEKPFTIDFGNGHSALAVHVPQDAPSAAIITTLELETPRPAIFITGGASLMSEEDVERTREIIEQGVAHFANRHNVTIVDGGTEAGVMQMIGDARQKLAYSFPLVGVSPAGKVKYPGKDGTEEQTDLEDSHSHFVLVETDDWGGESETLINLTRAIAAGQFKAVGVLINGGAIAMKEVFLATTQGPHRLPIIVLEGSGRTADDVATALRTGKTNREILKAIIEGGEIELVATSDGPEAMAKMLDKIFGL